MSDTFGPGAAKALFLSTTAFAVSFAVWGLIAALAPTFTQLYTLSATQKSLMIAVPVLLGSIGRLFSGMLADRFGGRNVMSALLVFSAIPAVAVGFSTSFNQLVIFGLFLGIAGTTFPVGVGFTARWFAPEKQGTALGIYGMGNIGQSVAVFFAPVTASDRRADAIPATALSAAVARHREKGANVDRGGTAADASHRSSSSTIAAAVERLTPLGRSAPCASASSTAVVPTRLAATGMPRARAARARSRCVTQLSTATGRSIAGKTTTASGRARSTSRVAARDGASERSSASTVARHLGQCGPAPGQRVHTFDSGGQCHAVEAPAPAHFPRRVGADQLGQAQVECRHHPFGRVRSVSTETATQPDAV